MTGQTQIEKNPKTGTPSAVSMIEVTMGPQLGQRVRWRGYLNSPTNAETTVAELRAMGMRQGAKLGDWQGVGSKDIEFSLMADVSPTDGKTYYRAAFIRPVSTLKTENAVGASDLDALNASLGALLNAPTTKDRPVPAPAGDPDELPPVGNGTEEIPF